MNRFGQTVNDIENIREIYTYKNLKVLGIYSHLCRVREFGEEPTIIQKCK
jgi:alanine racemase